jgi:hypothetical protein
MKKILFVGGLILAFASQAFSAQEAITGSVIGVSRKTNSTFQCGSTLSAALVWIKIKRADNGNTSWYVYNEGDVGREILSLALTSLSTGIPVRVYFDNGGFNAPCTNTYKIEELWLSNEGF